MKMLTESEYRKFLDSLADLTHLLDVANRQREELSLQLIARDAEIARLNDLVALFQQDQHTMKDAHVTDH